MCKNLKGVVNNSFYVKNTSEPKYDPLDDIEIYIDMYDYKEAEDGTIVVIRKL